MKKVCFLLCLLLISAPVLAGKMYKCESEDGGISFKDRPCKSQEKLLMSKDIKKERDAAIFLVKKFGEATTKVLVDKASEGDGRAIEIISVMEKTEALQIYSVSLMAPLHMSACKKYDMKMFESLSNSFARYKHTVGDLIDSGHKVSLQGIESELVPDANMTAMQYKADVEEKTGALHKKMGSGNNRDELLGDCKGMISTLDMFSDLYSSK